jgi:hypothetical protein
MNGSAKTAEPPLTLYRLTRQPAVAITRSWSAGSGLLQKKNKKQRKMKKVLHNAGIVRDGRFWVILRSY